MLKYRVPFVLLVAIVFVLSLSTRSLSDDITKSHSSMDHYNSANIDSSKFNVAVLLYDGALLLDYGIAAEMFLAADYMRKFNVYTISEDTSVAVSVLGLIKSDYTIARSPTPDIVIVPGGPTWEQNGDSKTTIEFLKKSQEQGGVLFSVCTGALLLAKAGILENRKATTLQAGLGILRKISPTTNVIEGKPFVDDGNVITAAGSGTAIEATLHVVRRFTNSEITDDLAKRYLNYPHQYHD